MEKPVPSWCKNPKWNFGWISEINSIFNYWQASTAFWWTIRRFYGKKVNLVYPRKARNNCDFLGNSEYIFGRCREYLKGFLNPLTLTLSDTQVTNSGTENNITSAKVLLAVRALKVGKAAGFGEIRPEMPRSLQVKNLIDLRVSSGLVFRKSNKRLENWENHLQYTYKNGRRT